MSGALIDGIPSRETNGEVTLTKRWKADFTLVTQESDGFTVCATTTWTTLSNHESLLLEEKQEVVARL